ncbi:MAG: TRAP transporter small permease [Lachnospiraceae bacterium]|nr:TRAP transporter small permease [Lachnospiraceae bacterium]
MLKKVLNVYDNLIKGVLVAIVASFIVIVFAQVICRYVFNNSLSWSEELAKTLFTQMIFLASPICVLEHRHITVDILHQYISKNTKRYLFVIIDILSFIFFIFLARSGFMLMKSNMFQKTAALMIPMYLIYAIIPISSVMMAINCIRAGIEDFMVLYAPDKEEKK